MIGNKAKKPKKCVYMSSNIIEQTGDNSWVFTVFFCSQPVGDELCAKEVHVCGQRRGTVILVCVNC